MDVVARDGECAEPVSNRSDRYGLLSGSTYASCAAAYAGGAGCGRRFVAVFVLFLVLRRSAVYRKASLAAQWFGAAGFMVLVQFYLAWLLWYQRPETLPTAAILALALLLLA